MTELKTACPECGKDIDLDADEIVGFESALTELTDDLEREIGSLEDEIDDLRSENNSLAAIDDLESLPIRPFRGLALCIKTGDLTEADRHLDDLLRHMPDYYRHAVEVERYSRAARLAAA